MRYKFTVKATNLLTGEIYTENMIEEAENAEEIIENVRRYPEYYIPWETGFRIEISNLRTISGPDVIAECLEMDTGTTKGNKAMLQALIYVTDDTETRPEGLSTKEMIEILDEM